MDDYLKKQIITYMGNKRKFVPIIGNIIDAIEKDLKKKLILAEGFSGSGIISRLFKTKASKLYTNDMAGYSETLNKCYLSSPTPLKLQNIKNLIDKANHFAHGNDSIHCNRWIQLHWSPQGNITKKDRVYYTEENGQLIDRYRSFICSLSPEEKHYVLAPLLVKSSIHTNTNGQFAAFYKDANGVGKYGGKKEIELQFNQF